MVEATGEVGAVTQRVISEGKRSAAGQAAALVPPDEGATAPAAAITLAGLDADLKTVDFHRVA